MNFMRGAIRRGRLRCAESTPITTYATFLRVWPNGFDSVAVGRQRRAWTENAALKVVIGEMLRF